MLKLKEKQQGVAGIIFVMLLPILFGTLMLGVDGVRAMQLKARLDEAVDAATLALAAKGIGNNILDKEIVDGYIREYIPENAKVSNITIEKKKCKDNPECLHRPAGQKEYTTFLVNATGSIKGAFSGPLGFAKSFDAVSSGKVKRMIIEKTVTVQPPTQIIHPKLITVYQSPVRTWVPPKRVMQPASTHFVPARTIVGPPTIIQQKTVTEPAPKDVIFVIDLSGSMSHGRLASVKRVINSMVDKLDTDNQKWRAAGSLNRHRIAYVGFKQLTFRRHFLGGTVDQYNNPVENLNFSSHSFTHALANLDVSATLLHKFEDHAQHPRGTKSYYQADRFNSFKAKINTLRARGGTYSAQGILRAGQIIAHRDMERPQTPKNDSLLIFLSDGLDSNGKIYHGYTSNSLSERLMPEICNAIKAKTKTKMYMVKYQFSSAASLAHSKCFGTNISDAASARDLQNTLFAIFKTAYKDKQVVVGTTIPGHVITIPAHEVSVPGSYTTQPGKWVITVPPPITITPKPITKVISTQEEVGHFAN